MKAIIIALMCLGVLAIVVAMVADYCSFTRRMKNFEKTYMDNDEFDYGHNVKHNEE